MQKKQNIIGAMIFCYVVSVLVFLYSINHIYKAIQVNSFTNESVNWPSVKGVIDHSDIESHSSGGKGGHQKYRAVVDYSYYVNGKKYSNSRLSTNSFNDQYFSPNHEKVFKKLQKATQVPNDDFVVFYDPEAPERSMLYRERFSMAKAYLGFFMLLLVSFAFGFLANKIGKLSK